MRIATCVILYNPDDHVEENIKSYISNTEKIYLVDNSETVSNTLKNLVTTSPKLKLIHDGLNEGIAKRLNTVCELALQEQFDFLLTMDQDSYFDNNNISKYINSIAEFKRKNQVAMFGINYQQKSNKVRNGYKTVKLLITSGSIINLSNYKDIGDFDENLFIDFVDTDYCFKSILKGYKIILFPNIYMHHKIGTASKQISLKTFRSSHRSIHSGTRLYYMTRNFLFINKKYKKCFKSELLLHKKDLLNRIKNKLLYTNHRFQTIKFLLKAYNDAKRNKMGKQF